MGAATYNRRFVWHQSNKTLEASTNQREEDFDDVGLLWGSLEELTGFEQLAFGAVYSTTGARIRLRNYSIPIDDRDCLEDTETGNWFQIDGQIVDKRKNEIVLSVHRRKNV